MQESERDKYLLPIKKLLPTWLAFLLILLPAVLLIALVIWGNLSMDKVEFLEVPEERLTEKNKFADWKTYQNEGHGFEVKHPKNWETTEWVKDVQFNPSASDLPEEEYSEISISIQEVKYIEKEEEAIKGWFEPSTLEISSIEIDSISAKKITGELISYYQDIPLRIAIILENNNKAYLFSLRYFGEYAEEKVEILNQVLSTFNFLE